MKNNNIVRLFPGTVIGLALLLATAEVQAAPVTVGSAGNEPIVTIAPDGTLYISALQHLYRSTDSGATWANLPGPIYASTLNLNSDSSISVDPGNRLYFTFDYPYAGTTAVCTSDDHGDTFACNPAVVPGGTDRMWVVAPTNTAAYEVTNQGLYQTAFLTSTDRGQTFVPTELGSGLLEPQTGPLLQIPCSSQVLQPIKVFGTAPSDVPELKMYVFAPGAMAPIAEVRGTGLPLSAALPSAAFGLDGALYTVTEDVNPAGGREVIVGRSFDAGRSWTKLPPVTNTTTGTATFTSVAAGAPGHVGVIYYYTQDNGDPSTLTTSTWAAMWAESYNADSTAPAWNITTLQDAIHTGAICVAASCSGTDRFSGDFITAMIDRTGTAHLTWVKDNGNGTTAIQYEKIQSAPPSSYVSIPCGLSVVSRKTHGNAGAFDIDLPSLGPHGVECRSGGPSGNHTVVFTFAESLTSVGGATVTSGTGNVSSSQIGSDPHQYIVNLSGVADGQTITVALTNTSDATGTSTSLISASMDVLLGDSNGDLSVNSADAQQTRNRSGQLVDTTNFRSDVNVDGVVNSADATVVRRQSGHAPARTAAPVASDQ